VRTLLIVAAILAGNPIPGQSPTDSTYYNALKINVAGLNFRNVSLQYERLTGKHSTVEIGASVKWGGGLPKILGWGDFVIASKTTGLRGYSFSPELKYYLMSCPTSAPASGLYAGIYSKFTRLYGDLGFRYWNGTEYIDATGYGDLHELGLGVELGYQFTLWNRLMVDLMFMGPRRSLQWLELDLESEYVEELVPLIEDAINRRLEAVGAHPVSIPVDASSNLRFWFTNFRYTVCVGYRF
jgi:hypothetical protein